MVVMTVRWIVIGTVIGSVVWVAFIVEGTQDRLLCQVVDDAVAITEVLFDSI